MPTDVHAQMVQKFSAYLDGDLSGPERAALEGHLASCAPCKTQLAQLRATLGRLGGLRAKAPGTFLADIQHQIRTRSRGRFFGHRHLLFGRIPFEWVSLAMIMAMLIYYIITMHSAPTQVAPGP